MQQWPHQCPPNTTAGPLSSRQLELQLQGDFSQVDGGSPPSWLDLERASELSCGRDT